MLRGQAKDAAKEQAEAAHAALKETAAEPVEDVAVVVARAPARPARLSRLEALLAQVWQEALRARAERGRETLSVSLLPLRERRDGGIGCDGVDPAL